MAKEEVMGEVKGVGYDAKREELNDPRFPTSYPAEKGAQNTVKPQQTGPKLTPVPSNLPEDPLNWPRQRREMAFVTLLLGGAVVSTLKTMLAPTNSVVATEMSGDYGSATALTGVPLIFGAFAGLLTQMFNHVSGKRVLYIGSAFLMLIGTAWNIQARSSYAQFVMARLFQGIGWGIFEGLAAASIADLFFVHERKVRVNTYNIVSTAFIWGSPIWGGFVSQSLDSYRNEMRIVVIMETAYLMLVLFASPETTFNRASTRPLSDGLVPEDSGFSRNFNGLRITNQYSTTKFDMRRMVRPLRALAAPSTVLIILLTAPLFSTAFGVAGSLSLFFSSTQALLFPFRLGLLFIFPTAFALLLYSLGALATHLITRKPGSPARTLTVAGPGLVIGVLGFLAFAMNTSTTLSPKTSTDGKTLPMDTLAFEGSLRFISAFLGVMVGGAVMLQYSGATYLSSFANPNGVGASEVAGAHNVIQQFIIGFRVILFPMWSQGDGSFVAAGLETAAILFSVLMVFFASIAGVALAFKGSAVRDMDTRVLGPRPGASKVAPDPEA